MAKRYRNPENVREYNRTHAADVKKWHAEHRERVAEISRASVERNRKKVNARNADWRRRNPDKCRQYCANRKARKMAAMPTWADATAVATYYQKAASISARMNIRYEVDHIIPLKSDVVCGLHYEGNLRVIPAWLNKSKGNRLDVLGEAAAAASEG